jgi:hypothetical protein
MSQNKDSLHSKLYLALFLCLLSSSTSQLFTAAAGPAPAVPADTLLPNLLIDASFDDKFFSDLTGRLFVIGIGLSSQIRIYNEERQLILTAPSLKPFGTTYRPVTFLRGEYILTGEVGSLIENTSNNRLTQVQTSVSNTSPGFSMAVSNYWDILSQLTDPSGLACSQAAYSSLTTNYMYLFKGCHQYCYTSVPRRFAKLDVTTRAISNFADPVLQGEFANFVTELSDVLFVCNYRYQNQASQLITFRIAHSSSPTSFDLVMTNDNSEAQLIKADNLLQNTIYATCLNTVCLLSIDVILDSSPRIQLKYPKILFPEPWSGTVSTNIINFGIFLLVGTVRNPAAAIMSLQTFYKLGLGLEGTYQLGTMGLANFNIYTPVFVNPSLFKILFIESNNIKNVFIPPYNNYEVKRVDLTFDPCPLFFSTPSLVHPLPTTSIPSLRSLYSSISAHCNMIKCPTCPLILEEILVTHNSYRLVFSDKLDPILPYGLVQKLNTANSISPIFTITGNTMTVYLPPDIINRIWRIDIDWNNDNRYPIKSADYTKVFKDYPISIQYPNPPVSILSTISTYLFSTLFPLSLLFPFISTLLSPKTSSINTHSHHLLSSLSSLSSLPLLHPPIRSPIRSPILYQYSQPSILYAWLQDIINKAIKDYPCTPYSSIAYSGYSCGVNRNYMLPAICIIFILLLSPLLTLSPSIPSVLSLSFKLSILSSMISLHGMIAWIQLVYSGNRYAMDSGNVALAAGPGAEKVSFWAKSRRVPPSVPQSTWVKILNPEDDFKTST